MNANSVCSMYEGIDQTDDFGASQQFLQFQSREGIIKRHLKYFTSVFCVYFEIYHILASF